MRRLCAALAILLGSGVSAGAARAQEIPSPTYLTYLTPGLPLPIAQQPATGLFQLYGDPAAAGYVDVDPRNGIDDARDRWLLQLSARFAPWMVRNTVDFPMDWQKFIYQGATFPLFVDRFDISSDAPRLVSSGSINMQAVPRQPCPVSAADAASDTIPDCRVLALLQKYGPESRRAPQPVQPDRDDATVLYFQFPGESPATWHAEFTGSNGELKREYLGFAKTFVHPFIVEVPGRPATDPRYRLVLQYWFFYPYNDAGNIHEGDWEHLNVVLTTRAQGAEGFSADEMHAFLASPPPLDEIVTRELQYYFHHWVFRLDYFEPNVYLPRDAWKKQMDALPADRVGEKQIWEQIRNQAYMDDAETVFNFHPIVFIGGDNRGLQALISKPSSFGRASHGSYPFVALYKDVGPQGTGELVKHRWNEFRQPPDSDAPETAPIVRFDNLSRLELVPDWERVLPMVKDDAGARAEWLWLVLPIRFGYPATVSPFAGIIKYAETGNSSIPSPPFNSGWNRTGEVAGYGTYDPNRLSSQFPASIQDNFQTGWGYFNLTVPLIATLPGFDIIYRVLSAPARATRKSSGPAFFPANTMPFRSWGFSGGVSMFKPKDEWMGLFGFNELFLPLLADISELAGGDSLVDARTTGSLNDLAVQWLVGVNLYVGRRFVSESSLRHSSSTIGETVVVQGAPGEYSLQANLDFWEFVGSMRYNLAIDGFQPYLKAGYGLSWYQLNDATFAGHVLGDGTSPWVRKPGFFNNLLPNTWNLGAGFEYIPLRKIGGPSVGVKAEAVWFTHNLGVTSNTDFLFVKDVRINRWTFAFSGTLSF